MAAEQKRAKKGKKGRKHGRVVRRESHKKYLRKHDQKGKKAYSRPGFQQGKALRNVLHEICDAGRVADRMIQRYKGGDLARNRAFFEHIARLRGLIDRLRRQHRMGMRMPRVAEAGRCGNEQCPICNRTV